MNKLIKNTKVCMLCIIGLAMVLSLTSCAKYEAVNEFNTLATDSNQLKDELSIKINESEKLLTETTAKDITDITLLDRLKSEIDSAKSSLVSTPNAAADTDAIKQQIQDLTTNKEMMRTNKNSLSKTITAITADKAAKLEAKITPNNSYSITATDSKGNKEKITIKIGNWIKGSETDLLDKAWTKVGGDGSMPLTDSFSGDGVSSGGTFKPKEAAYVFGTVTVENMTPDFTAKNFSNGDSSVYLIPQIQFDGMFTNLQSLANAGFTVAQGREYTSETSCDLVSSLNPLVRPDMVSNMWGSAPFVIGVENVFTPNFPDGNPKLNEAYFFLSSANFIPIEGDTQFQIGKTW